MELIMTERDNLLAALDAYIKKHTETHFEVQALEKPEDTPVSATTTLTKTPLKTKEDIENAENIIRGLGIPADAGYRDGRAKVFITPDQAATILRANGIDPIGMDMAQIIDMVYEFIPSVSSVALSGWDPNKDSPIYQGPTTNN
jgi:hypothetical protein